MKKRNLVIQKFNVEIMRYEQPYPFTTKPVLQHTRKRDDITARNFEEVIEKFTHKKQNIRGLKQMLADKEPNCVGVNEHGMLEYVSKKKPANVYSWTTLADGSYKWHREFVVRCEGYNCHFDWLTESERKERYEEIEKIVANTSNAIVNGNIAIAWKKADVLLRLDEALDTNIDGNIREITVYKVSKVEHKQMKSNYIKSNSKLAKWIHKRFVKYAEQLGISVPPYYINRRDIVERLGEYAVAHTNDSYCIGFCWYGSGVIWIDVNYHDLKWGDNQKEFRKNVDHTIAHEMVHLRFYSKNDPEHVDHDGSKRRRAFDRRVNQVVRGKKYIGGRI